MRSSETVKKERATGIRKKGGRHLARPGGWVRRARPGAVRSHVAGGFGSRCYMWIGKLDR